jgi:hypothetical protein
MTAVNTKANKAMAWLMFVVMVLLCAIIFSGAALIHYANAEERATFTDKNGHFAGSSVTRGNTTTFTDRNGFYQGTVTRQGTSSNPLKGVDGSDPFGRKR